MSDSVVDLTTQVCYTTSIPHTYDIGSKEYYHQAMKEARKMLDEDRKTYFRNKRRGYL